MKMKFIPAYLETETIEAVDLIARHKGVPRSAVIRGIIEEHVERVRAAALSRLPYQAGGGTYRSAKPRAGFVRDSVTCRHIWAPIGPKQTAPGLPPSEAECAVMAIARCSLCGEEA
jgi:hypothetical protein